MRSTRGVPAVTHDVLIGIVVVWAAVEVRQALRRRSHAAPASWPAEIAFRVLVAVGVLGALLVRARVAATAIGAVEPVAWLGIGLLASGVALRFWSFVALGRYFTVVVQTSVDQPVISRGPYRYVRHPSYAALVLAAAGVGLFTLNWLSVAVLVVALLAALVARIRVEEQALVRDLGEPYRDYAATRKRLVPFLW